MKNYNQTLQTNNSSLEEILNTINELPEAGGVELPELTDEGTAADLLEGKPLIDGEGNVITGMMPNRWAGEITVGANVTVPAGYYAFDATRPVATDATATASDLLKDKTAYSQGKKITGTIETFDGSYTCSGESTGGEEVTEETNAYTEKLVELETAITALENELEGKASIEAWTGTITSDHFGMQFTIHYTDASLIYRTAEVMGISQDAVITIAAGTLVYTYESSDAYGDCVLPILNNYNLLLPTGNNFSIVIN